MDIKGMKVAELKEELKRRGLATNGLKAELAERLAAAVEAEESTEAGRGDDGAGGDDSTPGDAPTDATDRPPASEEDVDFLDDAPAAPDATPRDPKAEPVAEPVAGDADPATRGVPDEEPEEEPDYEPDDEPTPPPKRPREEEDDADDAPETDADAKRPRTTNDDDDRDGDVDDDDEAKSAQSPATCALRIDNFVRPFTFNQVREMLRQFGAFANGETDGDGDGSGLGLAGGEAVWMNQPVKTHAVVVFASVESALSCAKALDGAPWPEESGRRLAVSHVTVDEARAIVRDAERAMREHAERVVAAKKDRAIRRAASRDRDLPEAGGGVGRRDGGIRFTRAWPRIAWRERRGLVRS